MRSLLPLVLTLTAVDARLGQNKRIRLLTPKSMGALHQDAFEKLGEKYSTHKPKNELEVAMDVVDIVAQNCPENDTFCVSNVSQAALQEFDDTQQERKEIVYPDSFDGNVKALLERSYDLIDLIEEEGLNEVLRQLSILEDDLENLQNIDEHSKMVGLTGLSIAAESTKLWHAAVHNRDHPFHEMIGYFSQQDRTRRTQWKGKISKLVRPDVDAATALGLEMGIINPVELVTILSASISASSAASIKSDPVLMPPLD